MKRKYIGLLVVLCCAFLLVSCAGSQKATRTFLAVDDAVHDLKERYVVYFGSSTPEQQERMRAEILPIWKSVYDALDLWQMALEADDMAGMEAQEMEFLRLKNQLLNTLYEITERRLSNDTGTNFAFSAVHH